MKNTLENEIGPLRTFFWNKAGESVDQPSDQAQWASSFASELALMTLPLSRIQRQRINELRAIAKGQYGFKGLK